MSILSSEEMDLALKYIKLPYVKRTIERDITRMEQTRDLKMYEVYVEHLHNINFKISGDIRDLKKQMSKLGMSIYFAEESQTDDLKHLKYKVIIKGKEMELGVFAHHLKIDVADLLRGYLKGS